MSDFLDAIIIGGGPAGLSAAIWLHKLGAKVEVIEAGPVLGGLQTQSPYENLWIPGVQHKTGQQVAASISQHVKDLGILYRTNQPVAEVTATGQGFEILEPNLNLKSKYLVIATGVRPKAANFVSSDNVAIGPGLPIEAIDVKNKHVAVLGGGDNAFDQARFIVARGAASVTVFSRSELRAQKLLQAQVPGVEVIVGPYIPDQLSMTINGRHFDVFAVMYGYEAVIPKGLILETSRGYVSVNQDGQTSNTSVFAAGEVTNYWHPCVVTSCAHGVQVAKRISERLLTISP